MKTFIVKIRSVMEREVELRAPCREMVEDLKPEECFTSFDAVQRDYTVTHERKSIRAKARM